MDKLTQQQMYDSIASGWWDKDEKFYALRMLNEPRFAFFDRFIRDYSGLTVADIGCGGGFCSEWLAARGALVTGVEPSAGLVSSAKDHAQKSGFAINYVQCEAENINLPSNHFDVVVCVDVLEHVENVPKVLGEIYRILKPGGTFFFDTINRTFKSRAVMIWFLENIVRAIPRGVHEHNKFIKPEELDRLLVNRGFSDIVMAGMTIKGQDNISKKFEVIIDQDKSVMYLGRALKNS